MKTWNAKTGEIKGAWWLLDANGWPLGRLAAQAACLLRGKHKAEFTPHIDTGDFVLVINADNVRLTGKKGWSKKYYSHSGFFGSLKTRSARELSSVEMINKAVLGMLPKNKMRQKWIKKLKIYKDGEHPHKAQKPQLLSLKPAVASAAGTDKKIKQSGGGKGTAP